MAGRVLGAKAAKAAMRVLLERGRALRHAAPRERVAMRCRSLGSAGLEVSEIGFGGEWLDRMSAEEARAVTLRAAELGELFTSNYMLHAFDDWKEGKLEYPADARGLDFSDPAKTELDFPRILDPSFE